jgi:hypothetical protein
MGEKGIFGRVPVVSNQMMSLPCGRVGGLSTRTTPD